VFKPTKYSRILEKTQTFKERALKLSRYSLVPEEDGRRLCMWCGESELKGSKLKKYCSPECSEAMFCWAQPQKGNGLHCLMVRQKWECQLCHFDYKPIRDRVIDYFSRKNWLVPSFGKDSSERFMKVFKGACLPDQKPEVDHIVPIYKGGQSLGLDNHQAICYACHKIKTKVDLSGKRKKEKS
jgi:hypothetical protein